MARCTGSDIATRGEMHLPVLRAHNPRGTIRRSRSGRRRAIVLATVQGLMIAHVVVWVLSVKYGWWGGRTTTPIEPSESMEFVKHGVINAGLIFFAVALRSTLILGRWFCGWGCHLVLLQDLCGWLMRKAGIRPEPFRSRLLIYVPLILALYMFAWPPFYRLAVAPWTRPDLEWPGFSVHLTTTDFWQTFPGALVAIPFLAICGFASVYFLGAKGFCTYGCPYGGFFAPVDEFAAGRIRVTDACEQCGHCTAVCTSNVRVHEEVREYGMVVDPGCMKCLDCVSVCPKDALYFGMGRPAHAKGAPRRKAPTRMYDLSWPEEIVFALVFLGSFLGVRGVYNVVPMLMAAGVAGVVTFIAWKAWRLYRDPEVRLHRFQLRHRGRMQPAGRVYTVLAIAVLLATAHSGAVRATEALGSWHAGRGHDDRAMQLYQLAGPLTEGGIGVAGNPRIDLALARLHARRGDAEAVRAALLRAIDRSRPQDALMRQYVAVLQDMGRHEEALAWAHQALDRHPRFVQLRDAVVGTLAAMGDRNAAMQVAEQGLEIDPDALPLIRRLAVLRMEAGDTAGAIELSRRSVELDPANARAHAALALALAEAGDGDAAVAAMRRAVELDPENAELRHHLEVLRRSREP